MKNKFYISITALLVILSSCDLNQEYIDTLTKEQVSTQFEYKLRQVTDLYTDLPNGLFALGNAMMASASDEAEYTYNGGAQLINSGSWNAFNNPNDVWSGYYKAIRKINVFLADTQKVNLDAYKNDPNPSSQLVYTTRLGQIVNWNYEARFLRAFYYFELVKRYGGIPIITVPLELDANFSEINRNSLGECFQFIVNECDSAIKVGSLPLTYDNDNLGRATKGAAMALRSRVLLYAASDLYTNPSWATGYSNPELISVTGDRNAKWKVAADAAKELINLAGTGYKIGESYSILGKTFNDPELIFVCRAGSSNTFETNNYPIGSVVGRGAVTPSQNLVDDYEMIDGTKFNWSNATHKEAPYDNRDPRFAMSVYFNQSKFKTTFLNISTGGANGNGVANATTTGYYIKKFIDDGLDLTLGRTSVHTWPLFRITEIYLNYAEALNEYNPGNPDIALYVNKSRQRAGVGMPLIPATLSQSDMRERIRNERRIELAFEDHRLWDVKRWMTATTVLSKPLYGVKITSSDFGFDYEKIEVEKRVFEPKMYFYPIPQRLLYTNGVNWPQNPLW